ncbi:hypothetical protein BC835DRAFT_1377904 [Cytidiella melzeri]|nr:hypothetical protein BC835DRAFT_1377904 [Cytidiella melzeri]
MSVFCNRCAKWFSTHTSFRQHIQTSSRHEGTYCTDCEVDFDTGVGLTQHYIQSPYHAYCRFCDQHFYDDDDQKDHMNDTHAPCKGCIKIFATQQGLHEHSRQAHPYCESCRLTFQNKTNLDMHLLTSAIHNPRNHLCPGRGCGRSFISYPDLTKHFESGTCPSGVTRRKLNDPWFVTTETMLSPTLHVSLGTTKLHVW